MADRKVEILWTKVGDGESHQRKRTLTVRVPFEPHVETFVCPHMTPELMDGILSLPDDPRGYNADKVRLPDPIDALTDEVVMKQAIPLLFAEIMSAARKKAEREDAERAEQIAVLEVFAAGGDPAKVASKLIEGGYLDYTGSNCGRYTRTCRLTSDGKDLLDDHDRGRPAGVDLLRRVEARIEQCNAEITAENDRAKKELEANRERLAREHEVEEAAKQERGEQRADEIAKWAGMHGSKRLIEQIKQGLRGWPLYLHERMTADWPGLDPELDNDGEPGDPLVNPTVEQLALARAVATRAATALGLGINMDAAIDQVAIVPIKVITEEDRDEEGYGYDPDDPSFTKVYVTFSGYRPGTEVFAMKTVRFVCEES